MTYARRMRPFRWIAIFLVVLAAVSCATEPETLTCDFGVPTENVSDDLDFVGLWHGYFSTDEDTEAVAAGCFDAGRTLGQAELACAIIETLDDGDGGYTLMFTDDGGDTYPVSAQDHVLLGPTATGLDSLARKFPFLSACPTTVPPITD